jgi:WD40 repeat protein
LKRENIPEKELTAAGGGDAKKAPSEIVAILGEHNADIAPGSNLLRQAVSPDGRYLADVTRNGDLRVWDLATAKLLLSRESKQVSNRVQDVAFSPDGRTLAFGRYGGGIVLWEMPSGKELRTLPAKFPRQIAFRPGGQMIAYSGGDSGKEVNLIETATGKEILSLEGFKDSRPVAFSPDGNMLAGGGWLEPTVKLWDAATGAELRTITLDKATKLHSIVFSPDGKMLATFGQGAKGLWDPATGKPLFVPDKTIPMLSVSFHPAGQVMVGVNSAVPSLRTWDIKAGTELATISFPLMPSAKEGPQCVAYTPDGRHVAVANKDETVYILRLTPPAQAPK